MVTLLIHDGNRFDFLIPKRKKEFPSCMADDFELAYRVIRGIYARKGVWRLSFSGDVTARERSVWERVDMICKAHHFLRAGKLVSIGHYALMGFSGFSLRRSEDLINELFPSLSLEYQGEHALSLGLN